MDLKHFYSCTLSNEGLATFSENLLQTHHQAQIHLLLQDKSTTQASTVIGAPREIDHLLDRHFPDVRPISARRFRRVRRGKAFRPRRLTELTLPRLPGIEEAAPIPMEVFQPPATTPDQVPIGAYVHPLTRMPADPIGVPLDDLTRHVLVAGTTGSGKTNLCLRLATALDDHVPVLVFDWKRDYRSLYETVDASVYGFSDQPLFTHNLLKPVGDPSMWVKEFAGILAEVISPNVPASGAKDVIVEELDALYDERGIYDNGTNYPHIGHLVEELEARGKESMSYRKRNWLASATRVLKTLTVGRTEDAFCVRTGLSLDRLLEETSVIELKEIGDRAGRSLLMAVLLQKIRNRLTEKGPVDGLRQVVVLEEAQNILARGGESHSVVARTCREIRSLGVGLIHVTQMPSEFSKDAMANTNTQIGLKLVDPEDKTTMAKMLGLERGGPELLEDLSVGEAVVKTDRLSLVEIPEVRRPVVHDADLPSVDVEREDVSTDAGQRTAVRRKMESLTPKERKTFLAIAESRAIYQSEMEEVLDYNPRELSDIVHTLAREGLTWFTEANRKGPGSPRTIYFLSPEGEEAYRAHTDKYADRNRPKRGDHKEMVEAVCDELGVERLKSDRFDVLFENEDGQERAIEIETGSNNNDQIETNIEKSLEFQHDARFVCADQRIANRVQQVAARYAFTNDRPFPLRVAIFEDFVEGEGGDRFHVRDRKDTTS